MPQPEQDFRKVPLKAWAAQCPHVPTASLGLVGESELVALTSLERRCSKASFAWLESWEAAFSSQKPALETSCCTSAKCETSRADHHLWDLEISQTFLISSSRALARLAALLVPRFPVGNLAIPTAVDHSATTRAGLQESATESLGSTMSARASSVTGACW